MEGFMLRLDNLAKAVGVCLEVRPMEKSILFEDIIVAPGVRETAGEDGAVLLDIEQGVCFSINPVGLKIWEMLKRQYSIQQMAESLERDFQVPRPQLVADVQEFLTQLETKQLIHHKGGTLVKSGWFAKILPRKKDRSPSN